MSKKLTKAMCREVKIFNSYQYAKGKPFLFYSAGKWEIYPDKDKPFENVPYYDHGAKAFIVFCPIAINRPIVLEEAKRFLIEYAGIKELAKTPFGDFMDVEFIKVRNEELLASL